MENKHNKKSVAESEQEILSYWKEKKIFEQTLAKEAPSGEFVFYDGPPFATGLPHAGSLLSSVIKDVVPRYKTMRGYRVARRWGWDCHGLPIESLIEKRLGLKKKKDIEKIGIAAFNRAARESVLEFEKEWEKYVERVGRFVDFKNSYKTMDTAYIERVWGVLKELYGKKLLYEGRKVLLYCPHCETPLAKAEIAMDNTYKKITEEAVTVKFKVKNPEKIGLRGDVYLLAWTTTPWTLPGNVALAVGGDIEYVVVRSQTGDRCIVAEHAHKNLQNYTLTEPNPIKGKKFFGLQYEPLFDIFALQSEKSYKVYAGDFVNTQEGTGIVHTAVMYGEDDFALGQREGLPMVQMLDASAKYNESAPAFLRGLFVKDAESEIKTDLEKRGLLFSRAPHTHEYPHCYRCGTPLIYSAVPSWFIAVQGVKERMLAENEKVRWVPEHLKHGRFKHIIEGAPDWNISRSRFWASPLPIWKNVRGDIKIVGSLEELQKYTGGKLPQNEVGEVDVHRPWIDELAFVDERGEKYTRVPEVVDCWVESAAMPYATAVGFPADFIAEYIAQTRTWFYYLHTLGVLLKGRSAFKAVVSTGTILAVDGEKISKSKGNYTDPMELMDQYGADALRFYLMGSVVMQGEDLAFSDEGVREAHNRVVGILRNCLSFFALYKDEYEWKTKGGESPHILDRWIFARLAACTKEMTEAMDAYDLPRVCREVRAFVEDYSTWYIRRSRERVKGENFEDKQHCLAAQRKVLLTLSKFIAPLMPFLAEEIYRAVGGEKESVHLESWEDAQVKKDDARIIEEMEKVRYIVSLALEQRAKANIKIRQPLSKLLITNDSLHTRSGLLALVRDEVNVKEVVFQKSLAQEVALDTFITPELKEEGAYRELVRAVQDLRKARGLTIADRVELSIDTDAAGRAFVEKYVAQLTKAALLSGVRFAPVKNGEKVTIGALSLCIDCTTRPR